MLFDWYVVWFGLSPYVFGVGRVGHLGLSWASSDLAIWGLFTSLDFCRGLSTYSSSEFLRGLVTLVVGIVMSWCRPCDLHRPCYGRTILVLPWFSLRLLILDCTHGESSYWWSLALLRDLRRIVDWLFSIPVRIHTGMAFCDLSELTPRSFR